MATDESEWGLGVEQDGRTRRHAEGLALFCFVFVIAENTKHFYTISCILCGFRKHAIPKSLKRQKCQIYL